MSQSLISLSLQNTTPIAQPISVFNPLPQQTANGSGNAAQTAYTYDVTSAVSDAIANNFTYLSVIYSVNGGSYNITTINYGTVINTTQKLLNALNSLNQATFFISGTNQISTYSISNNGNAYYYSSISTNANYTTNNFVGSVLFNTYGSIIYNTGYNQNTGVGTITRINTGNSWWINSVPNTTNGAFNRSGVASNAVPSITSGVGIFANVYSATAKQVYIGFSCQNSVSSNPIIYVNNSIVLNGVGNLCITSINSQLGTSAVDAFSDFWNIYPINITQGNNYILLNYSYGNITGSSPILAFQVYDNTAAQIAAATSDASLNILYNSHNYTSNMV
jgi:hypothetical protein